MNSRAALRWLLVLLLVCTSGNSSWEQTVSGAQRRNRATRKSSREGRRHEPVKVAPSACYKAGATIDEMRLDFVDSGFQWAQPGGPDSDLTITYSYSNLLDGQIQGVSPAQLKQAVEEALLLWSAVTPLHFVEVDDSGPTPTSREADYSASGRPQIRLGHHTIDGNSGGALAHAYLPYSASEGLAGDVHLDRDENWGLADGGYVLETLLHEIGHALGLDHEGGVDAIMNPVIVGRFDALGDGFLLEDDIAGIQTIYGVGLGTVTPLQDEPPEEPEPPMDEPEPPMDEPEQEPEEEPEETPETEPEQPGSGVTATFDDVRGAVIVAGDANANSVLLISTRWGAAVLGLDGTRVNGGALSIVSGNRAPVICEMGSGDDSVWTYRLVTDRLDCDLGEGDDDLVVLFSWVGELIADGGTGRDRLIRIFSRTGGSATGFE